MSRTLYEAELSTKNARTKLGAGVHWRSIDPDVHLGWRKAARGGRWVVRWYQGAGKYRQEVLATCDDALEADGTQVLSYGQALGSARALVQRRRAEAITEAAGPVATVRNAVEAYVTRREAVEAARGPRRDTRARMERHVLGNADLVGKPLRDLTKTDLRNWRAGLSSLAPTTVRRVANDLKAALNAASEDLPAVSAIVKSGLATIEPVVAVAREAQVLGDADVRRLVAAAWKVDGEAGWDGDLARLVLVLAATGARFSQVRRLTVRDVQIEGKRLMIPVSHKGKGTKQVAHTGVQIGDDVVDVLRAAIAGRRGKEPLLERWRHEQVTPTKWQRVSRGPWTSASEMTRPWRQVLKVAELSADVTAYSLRHSSIVRGLRAGLPVRLVAALHDTSVQMIEQHYSKFIVSALDELAARAVIPLS